MKRIIIVGSFAGLLGAFIYTALGTTVDDAEVKKAYDHAQAEKAQKEKEEMADKTHNGRWKVSNGVSVGVGPIKGGAEVTIRISTDTQKQPVSAPSPAPTVRETEHHDPVDHTERAIRETHSNGHDHFDHNDTPASRDRSDRTGRTG